jgi:CMP/dCMP kinase
MTSNSSPLIVAIDGPSGVGKTTTSKLVARELNLPHIDTGAMYRAIGLAASRRGIAFDDAESLRDLAAASQIEFLPGEVPRILLDGEDITALIRTPEISMAASHVSAVPAVRRTLVKLQQELGERNGGVLEGRDIGTKVFPETPHKFFLDARAEERAGRRFRELTAKGQTVSYDEVLADCAQRDSQDSSRADSPLMHDETYTVVDTSDMTIEQVVASIVDGVKRKERG